MTGVERLLERARANAASLKFEELCRLAEAAGFVERRQKGSHRTYAHPRGGFLNLQPDRSGGAKPYQVRQLLAHLDELGLDVP
jgi:hypothetical protein